MSGTATAPGTVLPPQLGTGLISLMNPTIPGLEHGEASTWTDGGTTYELWEMRNWSNFDTATEIRMFDHVALPTSNYGTTRFAQLNAAATANGSGRFALMPLNYGGLPPLHDISTISDNLKGEEWELNNGPEGGPFGPQVGMHWRIRYTPPNETREWQNDHWVLFTTPPDIYIYPDATSTTRVKRIATNVKLKDFLEGAVLNHPAATYVAVSYPLVPYDPALVP